MDVMMPSYAWFMASAVMLALALETPPESMSSVAFRDMVRQKYFPLLDANEERVRRWKREHWVEAVFLAPGERVLMTDLLRYAKETNLEATLRKELGQIQADVASVVAHKGPNGFIWQHPRLQGAYRMKERQLLGRDASPVKVVEGAVAELGIPFHLVGLQKQCVSPLTHLARNLPLLPDAIGLEEFMERPILRALPAVAVAVPPLRLGTRFHVAAVLDDVFLGAPFKIASLVRTVAGSAYIRSSPDTTYPITLRLYMNSCWRREGNNDEDLPDAFLDGSSACVRNIVIHIPAQRVGVETRVLIYIDASDYLGRWSVEELDQFERTVLMPVIKVEQYYNYTEAPSASRDCGWHIVTRWRAYTHAEAYAFIMSALRADVSRMEQKNGARLYAISGTPTAATSVDSLPPAPETRRTTTPDDEKRAYAYRVLPLQVGNICTAYAFTVGALLMQYPIDPRLKRPDLDRSPARLISANGLAAAADTIYQRVQALYAKLRQDNAQLTTLPEGETLVPGVPPLGACKMPALVASTHPYVAYTTERQLDYPGGPLTLYGLKDLDEKMTDHPGRLKQLITSICNSPYLRRYVPADVHPLRTDAIVEQSFVLAFTRADHTIMVYVAPAERLASAGFRVDPTSVPVSPMAHRFFYFDSNTRPPPPPKGEPNIDFACLISFATVDELDAYFTTHGINASSTLDMAMYVSNQTVVNNAHRAIFTETVRHGFLPFNGNATRDLAEWTTQELLQTPLETLFTESRSSPSQPLSTDFMDRLKFRKAEWNR